MRAEEEKKVLKTMGRRGREEDGGKENGEEGKGKEKGGKGDGEEGKGKKKTALGQ